MRCVDLGNDTLKVLGTHFSCKEKLKEERNFYTTVTNNQRLLERWKMGNLILEGKTVTFKTLAMSQILFRSLIATVPRHIVNELEKFFS